MTNLGPKTGMCDRLGLKLSNFNILGLQLTDINHDARISALEENGGGGSNNNSK